MKNKKYKTKVFSRRWLRLGFFIVSLGFCWQASAQNYSIDRYKISGGGGSSSGGNYFVSGTIGQPDAGLQPMSGGNYSLTGGFWSFSALQTSGAPALYISRSSNIVVVSWQNVPGWSLYQNSNLALPAGWSASSGVTTGNGTNYLQLVSPGGEMFFTLQQ